MPDLTLAMEIAIIAASCLFAFIGVTGILTYTVWIFLGLALAVKAPHNIDRYWVMDILKSGDEEKIYDVIRDWSPVLGRVAIFLGVFYMWFMNHVTFSK